MAVESDLVSQLSGKRVAFVGKLGGVNRREASRLLRQHGAIPVDELDQQVNIAVIGADELPIGDESMLSEAMRDAAGRGTLEVISETEFWHRLGFGENEKEGNVRRLYTPAMLAQLLDLPVATVRRWHRRGLIVPAREVHRLPYFDFQEVATARRLAELLAAGASPSAIEKNLEQLARLVPDVDRPLAQLSVIVEGRQLLLRQGEGLIEAGGQMRLDFDSEQESELEGPLLDEVAEPVVLSMESVLSQDENEFSCDDMIRMANDLEDAGQTREAIEMYRAALVAGGPHAEICFRLAELLYLIGDVTAARERYSTAVELDENYVEARANLGCVLSETGELELAIAAFQGALRSHPDYPDVHYHLARSFDENSQVNEAEHHWREFIRLAPDSPWAAEARSRIGIDGH
ncbi:MAG: tetratricopeptide repeat protein [Pirellulaceae bacterium]|nr:tetratricopeptide repeat protein [Pirellulaceae bacterium]